MESTPNSSTGPPPPRLQPLQPTQPQLPPGFRFHPTDEELVVHYLKKKAAFAPLPADIIAEVDLYKFNPWELPGVFDAAKANFGEQEWYFFSPRDRKYPNGARPNRAATSGYWKATGTDKPVFTSGGNQKVGVKKALVFYGGKPPKGVKTNWIMHEYRIAENKTNNKAPGCDIANKKGSLRLDDWVLCRIYKKNNTQRPIDHLERDDMNDTMGSTIPTCIANSIPLFEQNMYEGIIHNNTSNMINNNVGLISSSVLPPKRPLPAGLYWNEEHNANSTSAKRFLAENSLDDGLNMNITRPDEHNGFLSQLPQNQVLGSLSDGVVFRQPYNQATGMNWYS